MRQNYGRSKTAYLVSKALQVNLVPEYLYIDKYDLSDINKKFDDRCLTTHNDPNLYWEKIDGIWPDKLSKESLKAALNEYEMSEGAYIDVHAFFFTPSSFYNILQLLINSNLTNLKVERIYPTRTWKNEFWVILKKGEVLDTDPNLPRLSYTLT